MKTVELEKCLRVMGYPSAHGDRGVIYELLTFFDIPLIENKYFDMSFTSYDSPEERYCDPFKKELNNNLLQIENQEGKESAIRYYIMQFSKEGFKINPDILYTGDNHLDEFDKYEYYCHRIFKIILKEIDLACITYKIDFNAICKYLKVDLNYYDDSISRRFKGEESISDEGKDERDKNQSTQPTNFKELFFMPEWEKYVVCLEPYVITREGKYYFNGNPRKDKCIVASWFKKLQNKGKIKRIRRQQLSKLLNSEIENLKLGKDGKTFDTPLPVYAELIIEGLQKRILI